MDVAQGYCFLGHACSGDAFSDDSREYSSVHSSGKPSVEPLLDSGWRTRFDCATLAFWITSMRHGTILRRIVAAVVHLGLFLGWISGGVRGDEMIEKISPFIKTYCAECHSDRDRKGDLDLTLASEPDITHAFRRWLNVIEFVKNGEMPPSDSVQPTIDERNAFVAAVESVLMAESVKRAGDPGVILPRRLSNAEYEASIRDLIGVQVHVTKDFPADPAGGEGFNNTGEALGISPNLVKKYLGAAQEVSEHLVLKPHGISFAPYRVTSYNERKKWTELEIIRFYDRHNVQIDHYLEAAWRYRFRSDAEEETTLESFAHDRGLSAKYLSLVWRTLTEASSHRGLLGQVGDAWQALQRPLHPSEVSPEFLQMRDLIAFGRRLFGSPEGALINANAGNWPIGHLDMRAKVARSRDTFDREVFQRESILPTVRIEEARNGNPIAPYSLFLKIDNAFTDEQGYVLFKRPVFSKANHFPNNESDEKQHQVETLRSVLERNHPELAASLAFGRHPSGAAIDPDGFVVHAPAVIEIPITETMSRDLAGKHLLLKGELDRELSPHACVFVQVTQRDPPKEPIHGNTTLLIHAQSPIGGVLADSNRLFCEAFPNRFFYVDDVRGLAAGFHLVEGFFRDDLPLVEKVLTAHECAELDRLWRELDFVTDSAENLLRGFVWFERSEREVLHDKRFDFLRSEDPELVEETLLSRFEREYLEKLGITLKDGSLDAVQPDARYAMIHGFFQKIREGLTLQKESMLIAEQRALEDIRILAERAYRRPLSGGEYAALRDLYQRLRSEGQSVESSLRGLLIAILMSPNFSYLRFEPPASQGIVPLSPTDMASRLSFFLWSSIPDGDLLEAARSGGLQDETILRMQVQRMLKDPKVESFAREFLGQWLRYRDYLEKDPVLAEAFPGYTQELRSDIFDEPTHLATHLIRNNQPITELITSDTTYLNRRLAKHYGGLLEERFRQRALGNEDETWYPIDGLRAAGRGGLIGMAVTLTKNSAGERTSPVKRGFWSVHHLLGQHFPPPPADVPELPRSEKQASATIRELLAAHVAQPQCAMCHSHFDGLGIAMEGFDAIGRARTIDSAGRPIDPIAILRDGEKLEGIPGLADYIVQKRRDDFVKTMCRKFLGYALGRSVELSDQPLLIKMEEALVKNQFQFSTLFEEVVLSPQFRNQRGMVGSESSDRSE